MKANRIRSARGVGYTVTEMLVTLALLWIVMGLLLPTMRDVLINTRMSIHVNDWLAANRFARAEAIKRGKLVTVCRSVGADQGSNACHVDAQGERAANDWGVGWLVFVEEHDGTLGVVDPGEEILLRQGALSPKVVGLGSVKKVSYSPTGEPIGSVAGLHVLFHFNQRFERIVCMSRTGRSRVIRDQTECK